MTRIAEHFPGEEILSIKNNNNDAICISVVIPLHQTAPTERIHHAQLQKILAAVRLHLVEKYGAQTANPLMLSLEELVKSADTGFHAEGIGFFVSQQVQHFVLFFLPVKEKMIISNTFEIRDLLYQKYYSNPYYILHLSEKEARLFNGKMATITEITDSKFPIKHEDDYKYSPPSRGSSYVGAAFLKDYEQDKSRMKKLRYEQFLKNVDKTLSAYLNPGAKLIICGVENDIASFKRHTIHNENIAGEIKGNYTHKTLHELASSAWNVVKNFIDQQKSNLLTQLMCKS